MWLTWISNLKIFCSRLRQTPSSRLLVEREREGGGGEKERERACMSVYMYVNVSMCQGMLSLVISNSLPVKIRRYWKKNIQLSVRHTSCYLLDPPYPTLPQIKAIATCLLFRLPSEGEKEREREISQYLLILSGKIPKGYP